MVDPIETFKMPPELDQLLSQDAKREVLPTIVDLDRLLFERDPETEAGRGEGRHLWKLFDSIASKVTGKPNFLKLIEEIIPEAINVIRIELNWPPYNFDGDLKLYYLKAPIRKWRLRALDLAQSAAVQNNSRKIEAARLAETGLTSKSRAAIVELEVALNEGRRKEAVKRRCELDQCNVTELWKDAFRSRRGTHNTKKTAFYRWRVSRCDTPSWADELMQARILK